MLPDILEHNLDVVFCGTAVGKRSAERGHYYAGTTNRFWKTLAEVGFTPRQLSPEEDKALPQYGLGLTDLVKGRAGTDASLQRGDYDLDAFQAKIEQYQPKVLCFVGKEAAKNFLQRKSTRAIDYGLQQDTVGNTKIFITTSTSGANAYWDIGPWQALRQLTK